MPTKEQLRKIKNEMSGEDNRMPLLLDALGDTGRYRIFKILMDYSGICVTEIAAVLGITVPAVSQQLRILERVGLITKERMGLKICYEIKRDDPLVRSLCKLFS